jgi:hypothetical protein
MAKSKKLTDVSLAELQDELQRRRKQLPGLQAKRDKLAKQLAEVDKQIEMLQGKGKAPAKPSTRKTRKRPKNAVSLPDILEKVMKGKGSVGIGEAMEMALAEGYKSSSSQFRNIINQTLNKDPRFKKVARGQYTLKK